MNKKFQWRWFSALASEYRNEILLWVILMLGVAYALMSSGCAHGVLRDGDGKIIYETEGYGFFRDVKSTIQKPDGTVVTIETRSTTGEVLGGVNSLIGTASGTIKP